jgi:hypothetical protein
MRYTIQWGTSTLTNRQPLTANRFVFTPHPPLSLATSPARGEVRRTRAGARSELTVLHMDVRMARTQDACERPNR